MQQYGALAGLFNIPDDYATNMTGLQTISQVQGMMQDRIINMGPNAGQAVQQNIAAAQAELSKLRSKFSSLGDAGDMPDFKPNQEHTKKFFNRIELGINTQTVKNSYFYPVTTDLTLQAAYKLDEKNVIGVGLGYKMGLGKDIQHIALPCRKRWHASAICGCQLQRERLSHFLVEASRKGFHIVSRR